MLQQRIYRRPLIYCFNWGRERGLWKIRSSTGGCKLLDGEVTFPLGASVLCFVNLHKTNSSQTVNTIWAGLVFIACFVPGGSSCRRYPGGTGATGASMHHACLTWSSTAVSTPPTGHGQPAGSHPGTSPAQHCPRHADHIFFQLSCCLPDSARSAGTLPVARG